MVDNGFNGAAQSLDESLLLKYRAVGCLGQSLKTQKALYLELLFSSFNHLSTSNLQMGGARVNSLNKVLLKHHLHSNTLWCVVGGGA